MPERRKLGPKAVMQRLLRVKLFPETGLEEHVVLGLRIMLLTGMCGQIFNSITTGSALTGYIRALGAGDLLYSVFIAIPNIAVVAQLLAAMVLERTGKRRRMLLTGGTIARSLWLVIGLIPFVIPMDMGLLRVWSAFFLYTVCASCNAVTAVSFNSLISDFIPIRIRGNYLGTRARLSMIAGVVSGVLIAFLLDLLPGFPGYAVVFTIASLAGIADMTLTSRIQMPPMEKESQSPKLRHVFREIFSHKPFMRSIGIFTLWYFFAGISGPFFSVFMLNDLHMSFTQIMLMSTIVNNLTWAISIRFWGRLMDDHGARAVLRILMIMASFTPLLWAQVHPGAIWMIIPIEILGGVTWGPFEIGAQLTYFRQAPTKNRSMYIAVYAIFTLLVGVALGNFVGGLLAETAFERLAALNFGLFGFTYGKYQYLFILGTLGRLVISIFLVPFLEEAEEHREKTPRHVLATIHQHNRHRYHYIKGQILRRWVRRRQRKHRKKEQRHENNTGTK